MWGKINCWHSAIRDTFYSLLFSNAEVFDWVILWLSLLIALRTFDYDRVPVYGTLAGFMQSSSYCTTLKGKHMSIDY